LSDNVIKKEDTTENWVDDQLMTNDQWRDAWSHHLQNYQNSFPRTGFHLDLLFKDRDFCVLELGGATLRDAAYLADRGFNVVGSDYQAETIQKAAQKYQHPNLSSMVLDGFCTGLPDNAFDLTFHNGLWVCFRSNEEIQKLLKEQIRITSKYLIVIVHNAHNKRLRETFAKKAIEDPLYDIRFFEKDELMAILSPHGKTKIFPFGTRISNRLCPKFVLGGLPMNLKRWVYRTLCPYEPVNSWERLLAITELY
jgi:SAM-dependent methyltransferase